MPANSTTGAIPRDELDIAIVEGENMVPNLIGGRILADLPINHRNAHLVKATLADTLAMRDISANKYVHAPGTHFERLTAKFGDATVSVTPRGVEIVVPREMTLDYRNRFDVLAFFSNRFGMQISGLTKEKLIASEVFNTTNFGSATATGVAYTAANSATNSFFSDIIAATRRGKAKGEVYDTVVMSGLLYERVRQSQFVLAYIRGIYGAGLQEISETTLQQALAEFGIRQLLIADSYVNTAAEGATPALSQIWSTDYIWVGKGNPVLAGQSSMAGVGVPTIMGVGAMVYWQGYADGGVPSADIKAQTFEGGNYVEVYPDIPTDSMVIRVKMSHKPTILNARAGELLNPSYS